MILRPSQPDIKCTKCKVPENSTVTCTCSTDNLGQPGGRLVWYTGTNGVFDREIVRGNFEANRLTMTWPLNRSDHNVTMFRCVNEWLENVTALTDFTAIVTWDDNSTSTRRRRKRSADSTSSPCFDTPKDDHSIGIIAGSIAGGTVLISVVIIVCVIKRRKKGVQKLTCK
ncbi:uncharacterized protein [Littorina saxatilis]|uniref:uncharacterized protein n=1 Tax=Littorina saxatilis TaxID=31220 RepID=UPI0038B4F334